MDSLFSHQEESLATSSRPHTFKDFVGQKHFLNERFFEFIWKERWSGLVFWGPPGCGKTSLARIIAEQSNRPFVFLSAVQVGVKEIRQAIEGSRARKLSGLPSSILFLDEFHHLNRSQQDILLPHLEEGDFRLIAATTENPSFETNAAILSRCIVFRFLPLSKEEILLLLKKTVQSQEVEEEDLQKIARSCGGDARRALLILQYWTSLASDSNDLDQVLKGQGLYYDKSGDSHYDTISAMIKSIRGSDPQASIYYLARLLSSGENPEFIARRLVILAAEDIGNANSNALVLAQSTYDATKSIGMPEIRIPLAQVTIYLALSKKSNASYRAIEKAIKFVEQNPGIEIPLHLRNPVTQDMKNWGYGKDYHYPHGSTETQKLPYLPKEIQNERFYEVESKD